MSPIPRQDWFQSLQTCKWSPERRNYRSTWGCSWRLRLVPWLALSPHAGLQRRKARRLRIEIQEQVFLAAQDLLLQTRRPQKGRVSDERSCIAHLPPQNLGVLGPALLPQHSQSEQGQQKTGDARTNSGRASDVLSSKNIHLQFRAQEVQKSAPEYRLGSDVHRLLYQNRIARCDRSDETVFRSLIVLQTGTSRSRILCSRSC